MEMKEYTVNRTGKTTVRTGQYRREKGHGNNVELGERYYVAAVYEFQWSGAYARIFIGKGKKCGDIKKHRHSKAYNVFKHCTYNDEMYFSSYWLNNNCRRRLSDPQRSIKSLMMASFLSTTFC